MAGSNAAEITELLRNENVYGLRISTSNPTVPGEVASFSVTYEPDGYEASIPQTFDLTVLGVQGVVPSANSAVLNLTDPNEDSTNITLTEGGEAYTGSVSALSFNQDIATVSVNDNVVTIQGVGTGNTTVYITCQKPNYRIVDIPVSVIVSAEPISITINTPSVDPDTKRATASTDENIQISCTYNPDSDLSIEYTSSDTSVATVAQGGLISTLAPGTTTIHITASKDGYQTTTEYFDLVVS